jgi:hypothetical protein
MGEESFAMFGNGFDFNIFASKQLLPSQAEITLREMPCET